MNALVLLSLLAQEPARDPMVYLRAHREADAALVAGRLDEARSGMLQCLRWSPGNATVAYALACTEARAGRTEAALDWLERAAQWGYADAEVAAWDGDLAGLHGEFRHRTALELMRREPRGSQGPARFVRFVDDRATWGVNDTAVHPTGSCVAVGRSSGRVELLDGRTGRALGVEKDFGSDVRALDFVRSGETLIVLTWQGDLHFWSMNGARDSKSVDALGPPAGSPLWPGYPTFRLDPTGARLLAYGRKEHASLWTADGVCIRKWKESEHSTFDEFAWSPDGQRIAFAHGSEVRFLDGLTGEPVDGLLQTPAPVKSLAYHPNGKLLATGHSDNRLRVWDLSNRELQLEHFFDDILGAQMKVAPVAFSPDGRWVAGGTGSINYVKVLALPSGEVATTHSRGGGHGGDDYELQWSTESKRLWFSFPCCDHPLQALNLDERLPEWIEPRGRPPRIGRSGVVAGNSRRSVHCVDPETSRFLWDRPSLGREGELLKTSTGHFTTDVVNLDEIFVEFVAWGGSRRPLADVALLLFDPKRVRAAREGIAIAPVRF